MGREVVVCLLAQGSTIFPYKSLDRKGRPMNDSPSSDEPRKRSGGVTIGNVRGSIVNSIIAGGDVIQQFIFGDREERDRRDKLYLLDKVRTSWIKNVLERSVHQELLIELGKQADRSAVDLPWDRVLVTADDEVQLLPTNQSMLQIFQDRGNALLILGDPGSGKTITLLELARDAAALATQDKKYPIPVVFNLSSWDSSKPSLAVWLVDELNSKYFVPKSLGRTWIENNDLLLLLDGLDEVASSRRISCVDSINHFRRSHGLAPIVVCSRAEEYRQLTSRLMLEYCVRLCPLTPDQIDHYFAKAGPRLSRVRELLQRDDELRELAQTPLMLSVMSLAYDDSGAAPCEQVQTTVSDSPVDTLFDAYVARMFRHRMSRRKAYTPDRVEAGLAFLAKKMLFHNQSSFALENLQPSWLSTALQRWSYAISSRSTVGVAVALSYFPLSYCLFIIGPSSNQGDIELLLPCLVCLMSACIGSGIAIGLVDGWRFSRELLRTDYAAAKIFSIATFRKVFSAGLTALVGWVAGLSLILLIAEEGFSKFFVFLYFSGIVFWLLILLLAISISFALLFGLRRRWSSIRRDIQTVEVISLSWKRVGLTLIMVVGLCGGGTLALTSAILGLPVAVWDTAGNKVSQPYLPRNSWIEEVKVNENGTGIALIDEKRDVSVFTAAGGLPIIVDSNQTHLLSMPDVNFSDDGQRIAVTIVTTNIWNSVSGEELAKGIHVFAISPDVRRLVAKSDDGTGSAMLWDVVENRVIASIPMSLNDYRDAVKFNSTSTRFMTALNETKIQLWDAENGRLLGDVCEESSVRSCEFTSDGSKIVSLFEGTVLVRSAANAGFMFAIKQKEKSVTRTYLNAQGTRILTVERDGKRSIWDMTNGALTATLVTPVPANSKSGGISFNASGSRVFEHNETTFSLWDAQTGKVIPSEAARDIAMARFGTGGDRVVIVDMHGIARLLDAETGRKIADLTTGQDDESTGGMRDVIFTDRMNYPIFNKMGTRLITLSRTGEMNLWDARTGSRLKKLEGNVDHERDPEERFISPVQRFLSLDLDSVFSRDGNWIRTISHDGIVRLYDGNGQLVRTFRGTIADKAIFSDDSHRIVTLATPDSLSADWRPFSALWLPVGLLVGLFAGMRKGILLTKNKPNEGLLLSARNALIVGLIGGSCFLLVCTTVMFLLGVNVLEHWALLTCLCAGFATLIAFWSGAMEITNHFILRLILFATAELPWPHQEFLDYAADCVLLRKVGGQYIFIHRLMLDHFSRRLDRKKPQNEVTSGGQYRCDL